MVAANDNPWQIIMFSYCKHSQYASFVLVVVVLWKKAKSTANSIVSGIYNALWHYEED